MPALLRDIAAFAERIAPAGAVNGLAQTLLKLTVPGVPDIYQGTEFWDFSLVDPDNRRPVDFAARAAALGRRSTRGTDAALARRPDQAGGDRAHARAARGASRPVRRRQLRAARGDAARCADRVVAFARRLGDDIAITVVPRAASHLLASGDIALRTGGLAGHGARRCCNATIRQRRLRRSRIDAKRRASACNQRRTCSADCPVALLISPGIRQAR